MARTPALFLGHGSPMNIVLNNAYTDHLVQLGKAMPTPKAILVVSAHWLTQGTYITSAENPEIIYDFYGFPQELYNVTYPCPGAADQIVELASVFDNASIQYDSRRGLDHAAWAVLKHMYPNANIPTMELSLDYQKSPQEHYDLAKKIAPLREQGVLIIGSGNIVHNLRAVDWNIDAEPYDWAVEFDKVVKECVAHKRHSSLIKYEDLGKAALLSIPTNEHYIPMLYTLGLQAEDEQADFTYEGFQNASISMRCFTVQKLVQKA